MIEQFSINIVACAYPMAEMAVASIRHFYPDVLINVALPEIERRPFFDKLKANVIPNPNRTHHHVILDEMVKRCGTDFFVSCDDDIWMFRNGIVELLDVTLGKGFFAVGRSQPGNLGCSGKLTMSRLDPAFLTVRTSTFLDKSMTFTRYWSDDPFEIENKYGVAGDGYYDTGAFIVSDILRHRLKYFDFDYRSHVRHYGSASWAILPTLKTPLQVSSMGDVPRLEVEMFDIKRLESSYTNCFSAGHLVSVLKDIVRDNHALLDVK